MSTEKDLDKYQAELFQAALNPLMAELDRMTVPGMDPDEALARILFVYKSCKAIGVFGDVVMDQFNSIMPEGAVIKMKADLDDQLAPFLTMLTGIMQEAGGIGDVVTKGPEKL
jgi:hypothetical protein